MASRSKSFPDNPAEVLQVSSRLKKLKLQAIMLAAKLSGCWTSPLEGATASVEEMTKIDGRYWLYKCRHPILKLQDRQYVEQWFDRDFRDITLPEGFIKERSITFGGIGDLFQCRGLEKAKDILFEKVSDLLFDQTISYANFESPVTEQALIPEIISDRGPPVECCNTDQFDALTNHRGKRFTVLNTANNHILDMGIEGIKTTQRSFQAAGIIDIGTNGSCEDYGNCKVIDNDGIRIGFISATFGLNGRSLSSEEAYLVNVSKLMPRKGAPDLTLLKQQLDHCKKQKCDFVIASLHWGFEFEFFPRKSQIEVAHELIEAGVDTIIAHHPHVIQPVESYRPKRDPVRQAIIAYSLGTAIWGYTAPHLALSLVLNLNISKGLREGEASTYLEKVSVTPIFRRTLIVDGMEQFRLERLSDWVETANCSSDIEKMKQYCALVLNK